MFSAKLHVGWLIDGSGGPARRNMIIEVRRGRIESLAPAGEDRAVSCDGLDCLDFTDATALPGLIDAHVHLCLPETAAPAPAAPLVPGGAAQSDDIPSRLRGCLSCGVVGVRDGGDRFEAVLAYKKSGAADRPPVLVDTPGAAFYHEGRYGAFIGKPMATGDALPAAVEAYAPRVDHIKLIHSGINSLGHFGRQTAAQFTLSELRGAVAVAARAGRGVMAHANGVEPVRLAIEAGCRSIEHGYFMGRDNLMRLRDRQVIWVPTAVPMSAYARTAAPGSREAAVSKRTLDHQLEQIALARQRGVMIAAGSDAGSPGVGHGPGLLEEISLLQRAGFGIEAAIACATDIGARLMTPGLPGRIEPGAPASMVVVPGPPEALPGSLGRVRRVYGPSGCLYEGAAGNGQGSGSRHRMNQ